MNIFPASDGLEDLENDGSGGRLIEALVELGDMEAQAGNRKKFHLRRWPNTQTRIRMLEAVVARETGQVPDKGAVADWVNTQAKLLWDRATAALSEEAKERVLMEHAVGEIAELIKSTIHLERLYLGLKPLGEAEWLRAGDAAKRMAAEDNLKAVSEEAAKRKEIPAWLKGAILLMARHQSEGRPAPGEAPKPEALTQVAKWALGPHLTVAERPTLVEETCAMFERYHAVRQKLELRIEALDAKVIPVEVEVPPPQGPRLNSETSKPIGVMNTDEEPDGEIPKEPEPTEAEMPWDLCWRIRPVVEKEVRDIAMKIMERKDFRTWMATVYRGKLFHRWMTGVARRAYLRRYYEIQEPGERWRYRILAYNPVHGMIEHRVAVNVPDLKLTAKTEEVWNLLSDMLPDGDE